MKDYCNKSHRGQRIVGLKNLYGASLNDGLSGVPDRLYVLLADVLLEEVLYVQAPFSTVGGPFNDFKIHQAVKNLIYWPWPDLSTPSFALATPRIEFLTQQMQSGTNIEVACHGGHGRTGTLLSILGALSQGWKTGEAVKRFRDAYCQKAVESEEQERFVMQVLAQIRGEPIPIERDAIGVPAIGTEEGEAVGDIPTETRRRR